MTGTALRNIALLIDADNVSAEGIDPVLAVLAELGQVNIRRAYGNWAKGGLNKWDKITHRFGLQPIQQFDLTRGKNATDMAMTIDAMDLLYRGKVDGFGIMSSDSDFTPLVTRLRQDGILVYGFGTEKAPEPFRTACTRYIDVAQLVRVAAAEEAPIPPAGGIPAADIVPEVFELLANAIKSAKPDAQGFASLQAVGQVLNNRSSFDARSYGHKRLVDLYEADNRFKVERRDGGHPWVKRVR